jgi:hypothetical protein
VGFHYAMDDAEADFIIEAVGLVAREGHRFLPLYRFDLETGAWTHREARDPDRRLCLDAALAAGEVEATALSAAERGERYERYLDEARRLAETLPAKAGEWRRLEAEAGELQYFVLPAAGRGEARSE